MLYVFLKHQFKGAWKDAVKALRFVFESRLMLFLIMVAFFADAVQAGKPSQIFLLGLFLFLYILLIIRVLHQKYQDYKRTKTFRG